MKKRIVFLIILILCIFFAYACGDDQSEAEYKTNIQTETTEEIKTDTIKNIAETTTEEDKKEALYFDTDETIDIFFINYNMLSDTTINKEDIKRGNIDEKALVYIDDFSMEVINSKQGFLSVSISTNPENEETVLYNTFANCIKVANKELNNEEIRTAWEEIHETGYMVEGYKLNEISITYVPYKELSKGHSKLRIDLSIPIK